jgi:hypothetical protein
MRIFFLSISLFFFVSVKAQPFISGQAGVKPAVSNNSNAHETVFKQKWFFSTYQTLSTSISFFKGGHASVFSAPMGLQLNRRINNNWYAFANVTVAPSYISIYPSYLTSFNKNPGKSSFNQNSFRLYPAASLGLMYVNDAKTFSISGSISAEKSVYPAFPYYPLNQSTQSPVLMRNR